MEPLLHSKPQSHGPPTMFSFSFCFSQEIQVLSCREHWEKPCRNTGLFCWATVAKNATVQKSTTAKARSFNARRAKAGDCPRAFRKARPLLWESKPSRISTIKARTCLRIFCKQSMNVFTLLTHPRHKSVYGFQSKEPFTEFPRQEAVYGNFPYPRQEAVYGIFRDFHGNIQKNKYEKI